MEEHFDKNGKPTCISILSKTDTDKSSLKKHDRNGTLSKYSLKEKDKKGSIIKSKKKSFGISDMHPSAPFLSSSSKSYKDDDKSEKFNLGSDDWAMSTRDDWKSGGESNNNEDWP